MYILFLVVCLCAYLWNIAACNGNCACPRVSVLRGWVSLLLVHCVRVALSTGLSCAAFGSSAEERCSPLALSGCLSYFFAIKTRERTYWFQVVLKKKFVCVFFRCLRCYFGAKWWRPIFLSFFFSFPWKLAVRRRLCWKRKIDIILKRELEYCTLFIVTLRCFTRKVSSGHHFLLTFYHWRCQ